MMDDDSRNYPDNLIDGQTVPNTDVDSERAVLCLCLKHEKALEKCSQKLVRDDFSDPRNGCIFGSILELYMESRKIDRYTVADHLESHGQIHSAGGRDYLYSIAEMVAVIANIDDYLGSVLGKSRLRQLSKLLNKYQTLASSGKQEADLIVDTAVTELTAMRPDDEGVGFERLDKILKDNLNNIKLVSSGKAKRNVNTGFNMLDRIMGGMAPGSLNIIAARPGMGKTALAINIATNVARFEGVNVNFFSLEMGKAEIGNRVMASRTDINSRELQRANLSKDKQDKLLVAIKELQDLNIYVDDKSLLTPVIMMSKLKELKSAGKLGLVIVDHIQLMSSGISKMSGNRQAETTEISRALKLMAKEMEVPIIALSQLSRGAAQREDHTPMLSDLRDSGAIEQDADSVIFIDRPDYYKHGETAEEKEEITDAYIYLAKNRKGETGKVKLKWWARRTLFFEEDRKEDPKDPMAGAGSSSYTRTTSSDAASSDYKFEDAPGFSEPEYAEGIPSDVPPPEPPPADSDDFNSGNADFFDDSHDDLPPGMMD